MDEDEEVVFIWRLRLHVHVIVSKASPRGLGAKGQSCSLSWASTRLGHPRSRVLAVGLELPGCPSYKNEKKGIM